MPSLKFISKFINFICKLNGLFVYVQFFKYECHIFENRKSKFDRIENLISNLDLRFSAKIFQILADLSDEAFFPSENCQVLIRPDSILQMSSISFLNISLCSSLINFFRRQISKIGIHSKADPLAIRKKFALSAL